MFPQYSLTKNMLEFRAVIKTLKNIYISSSISRLLYLSELLLLESWWNNGRKRAEVNVEATEV